MIEGCKDSEAGEVDKGRRDSMTKGESGKKKRWGIRKAEIVRKKDRRRKLM